MNLLKRYIINKMFDIIVACTKSHGIGKSDGMAWLCKEELKLFKKITDNSVLIVGSNTSKTLPKLSNRIIVILSKKGNFNTFDKALEYASSLNKKIFVIGGGQVYRTAFEHPKLQNIYISYMKSDFECDTFIYPPYNRMVICEEKEYQEFKHVVYSISVSEKNYLSLLEEVSSSQLREGRNGQTKSLFGKSLSFDLREGFPLLTTKKMFFKGIIEEFLFFIRGETDTKILEEKGINIWKGNTSKEFLEKNSFKRREGLMGPMYGYQWRFFNAEYDEETGKPLTKGLDQLQNVINTIKNDPTSRRILMTSFNPIQASSGVLYPCHSVVIQFYVDSGYLDCVCYNRSQDLFLGVPFNIASSSLLLSCVAKICSLSPRNLTIFMGDVHIYKEHLEIIREQISRQPYKFPKLDISINSLQDLEKASLEDFKIENYTHYPSIKANMVA